MPIPEDLYNIPIESIRPKMPEIIVKPNPIHKTNKILKNQNEMIDKLSNKLEKANLEISDQNKRTPSNSL